MRTYLWGFYHMEGSVQHARPLIDGILGRVAACGNSPHWSMEWYGYGSADEMTKGNALHRCNNCVRVTG